MEWFAESAPLLKESLGLQHLDTSAKNVLGDHGNSVWNTNGTNSRITTASSRAVNRTNSRTNARQLGAAAYGQLQQLNALDLELFAFAKELCRCRAQQWLFSPFD